MAGRGLVWVFVLVGLIAGGCGSSPVVVAVGSGVVPWVDRPAPAYSAPEPTPIPYPTSAPPCRPAQLAVHAGRGGVGLGNVLDRFVFTNRSDQTCLVRGFPTITGVNPRGHRTLLPTTPSPAGTYFGTLVTADMAPGGHVYLDLATNDVTCIPKRRLGYRDLTFHLANTGTILTHARLSPPCNGWEMSPLGLPPRTTATSPPKPGSIDTLHVSLSAPTSIAAGHTLHYIITLTNPTQSAIRLAPCPTYTEYIAIYHHITRPSYHLNCDTIHTIAPHHHMRYHMQLAVPASLPNGTAKFGWQLHTPNEPATATMLTIDGPQQSGATPTAHVCAASQLRLAYGPEISPATGQHPRAVELTNRGHVCLLRGYPAIQLADASGKLLPFQVAESGDQMITQARPQPILLPPGGDAWIALNKYRCDLGDRQLVYTLQLDVPGGLGTATLSSPADHDWGYCGANDPGSTVDVSPFEPTLDRALAHG